MNVKLSDNYAFAWIYINSLVKVFKKNLFDNNFSFKFILKLHFIFVKWLKKN
jgi:hypothetical protein